MLESIFERHQRRTTWPVHSQQSNQNRVTSIHRGRVPSVRAKKSPHHQVSGHRKEAFSDGKAFIDQLQEPIRALWNLVERHKARPQLRPTNCKNQAICSF